MGGCPPQRHPARTDQRRAAPRARNERPSACAGSSRHGAVHAAPGAPAVAPARGREPATLVPGNTRRGRCRIRHRRPAWRNGT